MSKEIKVKRLRVHTKLRDRLGKEPSTAASPRKRPREYDPAWSWEEEAALREAMERER